MTKLEKQTETRGKSNKKKARIAVLISDKLKFGVILKLNQDKGRRGVRLKGTFF